MFIKVTELYFSTLQGESLMKFFPILLNSGCQSCFLSLLLDYGRILTPKFLLS